MNSVYITREELDKLHELKTTSLNSGGVLYYKTDNIIYKIFNDRKGLIHLKERNVELLINNRIEHAMLPLKKIYLDNDFYGYVEECFTNCKTFRTPTSIDYLDRLKIVKDIYSALKNIHKLGVYLGDIHNDNFLYKDGSKKDGVIVDFESIQFIGDEEKFYRLYHLRKDKQSNSITIENQNTDNIKTIVSSLSFIYGVDIQSLVNSQSLEALVYIFSKILKLEKLTHILNEFDGEVNYFDQYLDLFKEQDFELNSKKIKEYKRCNIYK